MNFIILFSKVLKIQFNFISKKNDFQLGNNFTKLFLKIVVDPAFRLNARMRFPLDSELDLLFEKMIFY